MGSQKKKSLKKEPATRLSDGSSSFVSPDEARCGGRPVQTLSLLTHIPVCVCIAPPGQRRANEKRRMSQGGRDQAVLCPKAPLCMCVCEIRVHVRVGIGARDLES